MTKDLPNNCCLRCVFLHSVNSEKPIQSLSKKVREDIKVKKSNMLQLQCYQGVWGPKTLGNPQNQGNSQYEDFYRLLTEDRGELCLFYLYTENQSPAAAKVLEIRAADRREATKDRHLTRRAFWIASLALVVSIYAIVGNMIWNIWAHFYPS